MDPSGQQQLDKKQLLQQQQLLLQKQLQQQQQQQKLLKQQQPFQQQQTQQHQLSQIQTQSHQKQQVLQIQPQLQQQQHLLQTQPQPHLQRHKQSLLTQQILQQEHLKQQQLLLERQQKQEQALLELLQLQDNNDEKDIQEDLQIAQQRPQLIQQQQQLHLQQQHRQQQEQQQQLQELKQKLSQPQQQLQLVQQPQQQQPNHLQNPQLIKQLQCIQKPQPVQQPQINQTQNVTQSQLVQQIQKQQSQFVHQIQQQHQHSQDSQQSHVVKNPQVIKQRQIVQKPQVIQQPQIVQQSHLVQQSQIIHKTQQQQLQHASVSTQQKIKRQPPHSQQQLQQQLQQLLSKNKNYPQRIVVLGSQSSQQQQPQQLMKQQQQQQQLVTQQKQQLVTQQQQQLVTQQQQQFITQQQQQLVTQQQQQLVTQQAQRVVISNSASQQQQQLVAQQSQRVVVTNSTSQQQQLLPQQMQCVVVTGTGQQQPQQMQRVVMTSTGQQQQQQQQIHRVIAGSGKQQQQMQRIIVGATSQQQQQQLQQIQHVVVQGTSQHQPQQMQNIVNTGSIQQHSQQMQCVVVTSASGQQLAQQLQPAAQRIVANQTKQTHQTQQIQSSPQCGAILSQPQQQDIQTPMVLKNQQQRIVIAGQQQLVNSPLQHQLKSPQQLSLQQQIPHQLLQIKPQQQVVQQLQQQQQAIQQQKKIQQLQQQQDQLQQQPQQEQEQHQLIQQQQQLPQRVVLAQQQQQNIKIMSDESSLQELHIKQSHQQLQQLHHVQTSQNPLQQQPQQVLQQQNQNKQEEPVQLNRSGVIVGQLQRPVRPEPGKMQQQFQLQQLQRQKLQEYLLQQHWRQQQQQQQKQQQQQQKQQQQQPKQLKGQQPQQKHHQQQLREKVLLQQHLKRQQQQQLQQQLLFRQQLLSENRVSFVAGSNHEPKKQDDKETINRIENSSVPKSPQISTKIFSKKPTRLDVKHQVDRVMIEEKKRVLLSSSSDEDEDDDMIRKERNLLHEAERLVHERYDALSITLGPKCQVQYDKILKNWLDGQLSRDEFDTEIHKVLYMPLVLPTTTKNKSNNGNDAPVIITDTSKTIAVTKNEKDTSTNINNPILADRMPFHNALVSSLVEWMPLNCHWMERRMARARGVTETGCPLRLYTYADVPQARGASDHWYSAEPGSLVRWYWPDRLPCSSSMVKINDGKQLLQTLFQGKRKMEEVDARIAATVLLRPPPRALLPLMMRMATDSEVAWADKCLKDHSTKLHVDVIKQLQWQRLKAKKQLVTMVRLRDGHTKLLHELKIRSRELENQEYRLIEKLYRLRTCMTQRRRKMLVLFKNRLQELQTRMRKYFDRSWQECQKDQIRQRLVTEVTKTVNNEEIDEGDEDVEEDRQVSFLKHLEKFRLLEENRKKQQQTSKTKTTTSTLQLSYRDRWLQSTALLRDRQRYRANYQLLQLIRKERLQVINYSDRVRELRHKHCPCGEFNDQPCRYRNQMRQFRKRLRSREQDTIETEINRKLAEVAEKEKTEAEESQKLETEITEEKKVDYEKNKVDVAKVKVSRKRKAKTVKARSGKKNFVTKVNREKLAVPANGKTSEDISTKMSITTETKMKRKTTNNSIVTNKACSPIANTETNTVGTTISRTSDFISPVPTVGINCRLHQSEKSPTTQINVLYDGGIQPKKQKRSITVVAAATQAAQAALAASRCTQKERSDVVAVAAATAVTTPYEPVDENGRRASELMPPPPPPKTVTTTRKPSIGARYLQQQKLLLDRHRQLERMRRDEEERQQRSDDEFQRKDEENNKSLIQTEDVSDASSPYLPSSLQLRPRRCEGTSAVICHDLGLDFYNEDYSLDDDIIGSSSTDPSFPPLLHDLRIDQFPQSSIRPTSVLRTRPLAMLPSFPKHRNVEASDYVQEYDNKLKQENLHMHYTNKINREINNPAHKKMFEPSTSSSSQLLSTVSMVTETTKSPQHRKLSTMKRKKLPEKLQLELVKRPSQPHQHQTIKANRQFSKNMRARYKNKLLKVEEKQEPIQHDYEQQVNTKTNLEHKSIKLVDKEKLDINNSVLPTLTNPLSKNICSRQRQQNCTNESSVEQDEPEIVMDMDELQLKQGKSVIYKVDSNQEYSLNEDGIKNSPKVIKHPDEKQDKVELQSTNKYWKLRSEIDLRKRNCIEIQSLITKYLKLIENLLPEQRLQHLVYLQQQLKPPTSIENIATDPESLVYQNIEKLPPIRLPLVEKDQMRSLLSKIKQKHHRMYRSIEILDDDKCCAKVPKNDIQNVITTENNSINDISSINGKQCSVFGGKSDLCDNGFGQISDRPLQEQKQRLQKQNIIQLELLEKEKQQLGKQNRFNQLERYKRIKQLEQRKQLLEQQQRQEQKQHKERQKKLLERQQKQLRPKCHWMIRKLPVFPKQYYDELLPLREQLMRKIIENKNSQQSLEIEHKQQQITRSSRKTINRGSRYWWTKIGLKRQISSLVVDRPMNQQTTLVTTVPIANHSQLTKPQVGEKSATVVVKNQELTTPTLLTFNEKKKLKQLLTPQLVKLMTKVEKKCLQQLQFKIIDLNRRVGLHWKAMMAKHQQQVQLLLQHRKQQQENIKRQEIEKLQEERRRQELEKQKAIEQKAIEQKQQQEEIKRKEREQYLQQRNKLLKENEPIIFLQDLKLQKNNIAFKKTQETMQRKQYMEQRNKLLKMRQPVIFLEKLELEQYKPGNIAQKEKKFEKQEIEQITCQQPIVLIEDVVQQQNMIGVSQQPNLPVKNTTKSPQVIGKIETLAIVASPTEDVSKVWRELEAMRKAYQSRWKMRLQQLFEIKWINKMFARALYDRLIKLHKNNRKQKQSIIISALKRLQHKPLKPIERQQLHQKIKLQKILIQQEKLSVKKYPLQKLRKHQQQQCHSQNSTGQSKSPQNKSCKQQRKPHRKDVSVNIQQLHSKRPVLINQPLQSRPSQTQKKLLQKKQKSQIKQSQLVRKQKHSSLPKSVISNLSNLKIQSQQQKQLNLRQLMSSASTNPADKGKPQQEELNKPIKWILRKLTFLLHNQRIVLERQLNRLNDTVDIQQDTLTSISSIQQPLTTMILTPTTLKQQSLIPSVILTPQLKPLVQKSKQPIETNRVIQRQQQVKLEKRQLLKERLGQVLSQLKPLMELWQLSLRFPRYWLSQQLDEIEQIKRDELEQNQNDRLATSKSQWAWQQLKQIRDYLEWRQQRVNELIRELAVVIHRKPHPTLSKSNHLQSTQSPSKYSVLLKLQQPSTSMQQPLIYTVVLKLKQPLMSKSQSLTYSTSLTLQKPLMTNQASLKYSSLLKLTQLSKSKHISSMNSALLTPQNPLMEKKQFSMILTPQESSISKHESNNSVIITPKSMPKESFADIPKLPIHRPSISVPLDNSLSKPMPSYNKQQLPSVKRRLSGGNKSDNCNKKLKSMSKKMPSLSPNSIRSKRLQSKSHNRNQKQADTIDENINRRGHGIPMCEKKVRRRRHLVRTVTVDTHGPAVPIFRDHGFSDGTTEQVVHERFVATIMAMNAAPTMASYVRPGQPSIPLECAITKNNSSRLINIRGNNNNHNTNDKVTVSTNTPIKLSSIMDLLEKADESHTNSDCQSIHWSGCARTAGTTLVTAAKLAKKQMTDMTSAERKTRLATSKTEMETDKRQASVAFMTTPSSSSVEAVPHKRSKSAIGANDTKELSKIRSKKRSASMAFSSKLPSSSNVMTESKASFIKNVTVSLPPAVKPRKISKSAVVTITTSNPEKMAATSMTSVTSKLISPAKVVGSLERSKLTAPVPATISKPSRLMVPPSITEGATIQTGITITPTEAVADKFFNKILTPLTAATETITTDTDDDSGNVKVKTTKITEEQLRTVTVNRTLCPTVQASMDVTADACTLVASTCEKFVRAMVMERLKKAGRGAGTLELRRRDMYAAAMVVDDDVRAIPEFCRPTTIAKTTSNCLLADTSNDSWLEQQRSKQPMSIDVGSKSNKSTVMIVETAVDTQITTTTTVSITTAGNKQCPTMTSVSGIRTKPSPIATVAVTDTSARTRGIVDRKTTKKRTEADQRLNTIRTIPRTNEISSISEQRSSPAVATKTSVVVTKTPRVSLPEKHVPRSSVVMTSGAVQGFFVQRGRPLLRPEFHRRRPFGTLAATCVMAAAETTAVNDNSYTYFNDHNEEELNDGGQEHCNNDDWGGYFSDPKLLPPVSRLNRYLVDDNYVVMHRTGDRDNNDHHRVLSKMSTKSGGQQRRKWPAFGGVEQNNHARLEEEEELLARQQQRLMSEIVRQQQQRKQLEQELQRKAVKLQDKTPDSEEEHYRKFLHLQYGSTDTSSPLIQHTKIDGDGHCLVSW